MPQPPTERPFVDCVQGIEPLTEPVKHNCHRAAFDTGGVFAIMEMRMMFSLALDPYPRKPDAAFEPPADTTDDVADSPFGRLAARDKKN